MKKTVWDGSLCEAHPMGPRMWASTSCIKPSALVDPRTFKAPFLPGVQAPYEMCHPNALRPLESFQILPPGPSRVPTVFPRRTFTPERFLFLTRGVSVSCFLAALTQDSDFDALCSMLSPGPSLPRRGDQQPSTTQTTSHLLNINWLLSTITLTTSFDMAVHGLWGTAMHHFWSSQAYLEWTG